MSDDRLIFTKGILYVEDILYIETWPRSIDMPH